MTTRGSTQAQLDAMTLRIDALAVQVAEDTKVRGENHAMLSSLHSALMVAQPGQDGKALLERMAEVTVDIESGKRTANSIVVLAKWFAAIGAVVGLFTSIKLGFWQKL